MARKAADLYVKEIRLSETGAALSSKFFAVYQVKAAEQFPLAFKPRPEEITQQAYSAAQARGSSCTVRLVVPANVEIVREG